MLRVPLIVLTALHMMRTRLRVMLQTEGSPRGAALWVRRKEKLWPHTREFADRAIAHVSNMLKKLQEVGEPCSLYTVCAAPR